MGMSPLLLWVIGSRNTGNRGTRGPLRWSSKNQMSQSTSCLSPAPTARQNSLDYQAQAKQAFEHEARLKELLARQAQLNAALDLHKSDAQAAEPTTEPDLETAALPGRTAPGQLRQERSQAPYQPRSPEPTNQRFGAATPLSDS